MAFLVASLDKILFSSCLRPMYPNAHNCTLHGSFSLASHVSFPIYFIKVFNNVYQLNHDIPTVVWTITNPCGYN